MPVIVVGADAPPGLDIVSLLAGGGGEVRVFVSDPGAVPPLRAQGAKVATGDVSDASHVGGAALGCHSAVLIGAAASDGRETAFSPDPAATVDAWAAAMVEAEVRRLIWVSARDAPDSLRTAAPQLVTIDPSGRTGDEVAAEVAAADDAASM